MVPVYLLLGPERGEKARFVQRITNNIEKRDGEPPEVHRAYAFEAQIPDVLVLLRNGCLFSRHTAVILNDAEQIKSKDDLALLAEYIARPAAESTLILVSDSANIGSVSRKIQDAVPKGGRKIFWEMFEDRKLGWIRSYFDKRRIHISAESAAFLLEMIENNTLELEKECERLALFFGPDTELGIDTISQYIYHGREENVFTLFERLAARDFPAAQEILSKILLSKESDSTALMGGLLWQARKLIDLKRLLLENYSPEEAFSRIDIKGKRRRAVYMKAHEAYTLGEVRSFIPLIAEFEMRLRSCRADLHPVLLQLFLYYAVVKGGKAPFAVTPGA